MTTVQPAVRYLTTDSVAEGVGVSQVLAYARGLARRGVAVELHTFEKVPMQGRPTTQHREGSGELRWVPHHFGRYGALGGLGRVVRGAGYVRGAELVHARSDLAAASCLIARPSRWVWDVRSFWADQRIALGLLRPGGLEERLLRRIERASAVRASAIVTLSNEAVGVLMERHGRQVADKAVVIPTCVDLDRFSRREMPDPDRLELVTTGTLNRYYDVPLMVAFAEECSGRRPSRLTVVSPGATAWEEQLARSGAARDRAAPADVPARIALAHAGLSICRSDAGVSLKAAVPTKIAEFLATGRPVVVNPGLGDMDAIIREHQCGVVVGTDDGGGLATAVDELLALIDDPDTPARCRAAAEQHFDLTVALDTLTRIYESVSA